MYSRRQCRTQPQGGPPRAAGGAGPPWRAPAPASWLRTWRSGARTALALLARMPVLSPLAAASSHAIIIARESAASGLSNGARAPRHTAVRLWPWRKAQARCASRWTEKTLNPRSLLLAVGQRGCVCRRAVGRCVACAGLRSFARDGRLRCHRSAIPRG